MYAWVSFLIELFLSFLKLIFTGYSFFGLLSGTVAYNPPAKQETRVPSVGQEDPPEKEIASHSSILTWEVPRTKEPGGLQSMGSHRGGHHSVARWRPQLLYDAVLVSAVQ